ncbi:hypothetical protein HDV05_007752 [Chytridiales sp. JEL 0842]|nr:hypothetical protein HDV05_007752 [Chytridiales sp. JEL 0842]
MKLALHGILFDIGVSSQQIDNPARGFSFGKDGPLDMRMCADPVYGDKFDSLANRSLTAEFVVNAYTEESLAEIIKKFGEERRARSIARAIVQTRQIMPISRTKILADVVARAIVGAEKRKTETDPSIFVQGHQHPASRTFQALRIYINDELNELRLGLKASEELLKPGGSLVVLTFHSLEDRIVKDFMKVSSGKKQGLGLRYWKHAFGKGSKGIEIIRSRKYPGQLSYAQLDEQMQTLYSHWNWTK